MESSSIHRCNEIRSFYAFHCSGHQRRSQRRFGNKKNPKKLRVFMRFGSIWMMVNLMIINTDAILGVVFSGNRFRTRKRPCPTSTWKEIPLPTETPFPIKVDWFFVLSACLFIVCRLASIENRTNRCVWPAKKRSKRVCQQSSVGVWKYRIERAQSGHCAQCRCAGYWRIWNSNCNGLRNEWNDLKKGSFFFC